MMLRCFWSPAHLLPLSSQTFAPVLQLLQSALKGGPAKPKEGKVILAPAVKSSRCERRRTKRKCMSRL